MVRALVSVCPESVNDIDYGSRTPLHYAARKGRVAVATHLLESGAAADYRYKYTTETCGHLPGNLRSNDATVTRTSLKKRICVFPVFIAIIPTHLLCQM